jgi:hypothetical protein
LTEPVSGISTIKEPGKKKAPDTLLKHEKSPRHTEEAEEDSVDISDEAREKAAGKNRRNILDYLNEEPA